MALVGYVKSDLIIVEELSVDDLKSANAKGMLWFVEVNAQVHSEIAAIPAERLALERSVLCRYSGPGSAGWPCAGSTA